MTRQESLEKIWMKLGIPVFVTLLFMAFTLLRVEAEDGTTIIMMFIVGNLGGYTALHRNLSIYSDEEIYQISKSWFGVILPPVMGGILAMVLYLLFVSGIIEGALFPNFEPDATIENASALGDFTIMFAQHGKESTDYAKLLFWGFVAGFNEKYVTNVIDSIRTKSTTS